MLNNLIGNAVKFSEKGTIRVRIERDQEVPGVTTLGFIVSDEGIGISEKHLPHIFNSFSQAGPDIARKYGGTGLGLAISNRLLALQGGDIDVRSTEGEGTTFRFRIPFKNRLLVAPARSQGPVIGNYEGFLQDYHFLVVEDLSSSRISITGWPGCFKLPVKYCVIAVH